MSKYVAILAGGRIGIHAHSSNGNTATLCGMDGDDPHPAVDQKIVSVPANAKIDCEQCQSIILQSLKYSKHDFKETST